ncbi:hypothetical protein CCR75_003786 [Bremia lactucae]|uniref:Calcineurin-binding protein cabin-1 n=1 Tax=Bremia lactucae TaxID=4779 RepID=A0A976IJJ7_BRELC|nr:hypothetical protein CCR75_003786 [Bremia lactucae]
MASWAALNVTGGDDQDSLAQERATEEAQDAEHAAVYERALRCQQQQQTDKAKALYLQLLRGRNRVSPRLEYLCNKNVATMEQEAQSFEYALSYYAAALALDATDVVVWFQMATTAIETGQLWLARRTLEEGLKVDATYWPLVETLAQVLSQIGDEEEYKRVIHYLRQNDPHCPTLNALSGPKKRSRPLSTRDIKLRSSAKKKLQHIKNIVGTNAQKRIYLQREMNDQLKTKRQFRTYKLLQPSWTKLGHLLLEIFEEIDSCEHADVLQAEIRIREGYDDEMEEDENLENDEKNYASNEVLNICVGTAAAETPTSKLDNGEVTAKAPASLETYPSIGGISDNDTQDSGIYLNEFGLQPTKRRKSRRNEKRLREEHAAAVKIAREKDLTYRLEAFLPELLSKDNTKSCLEADLIKWLLPLDVKLIHGEFCITDVDKNIVLKTDSFAMASSTNDDELQSSQAFLSGQTIPNKPMNAECLNGGHVATFIRDKKVSPCAVMDWVRHFLNQCGSWFHLKFGSDVEDIYSVCLWLEKISNGELDVTATPLVQTPVITVANHSLIENSRFKGNGLTLGTRLFLLELHFDRLSSQLVRGRKLRKIRKLVDFRIAQAQKLLFEYAWLEDSEDGISCLNVIEFLRLLWLIARMYERCESPRMALHYFIKCREKMSEHMEADDDNNIFFRVNMPNQKVSNVITMAALAEKISGLRFSDVCSEARRYFGARNYDQVVSILLGHYFPLSQSPRMNDFLYEFETVLDDVQKCDCIIGKTLFEMLLESIDQSPNFSEKDTYLLLLTILYHVIEFLDRLDATSKLDSTDEMVDEVCMNALAAIKSLLQQLVYDKREHTLNPSHQLLLRGLSVRCLTPSILLRSNAPVEMLTMLELILETEASPGFYDITERMIGVDAVARLLYDIRSLPSTKLQTLLALVPKKKHVRCDRVRLIYVELLRFLIRAFQTNYKLALSLSLLKRSILMRLCGILMKEEEKAMARCDDKISNQLFGNGAILFMLLFESYALPNLSTFPSQLIDLVHLLHERLGQHGLCGMTFISEPGSDIVSRSNSCFLKSCVLILDKFMHHNASVWIEKKPREPEQKGLAEDYVNEREAFYHFQMEVCQCYRCLYDVQIQPGCEDHKTGTTFALLQSASPSEKYENALRLARFAVPILLNSQPKNNGQKKERLKLLYAVRDALFDTKLTALLAQTEKVCPQLTVYLSPQGLLQEAVRLPLPLDSDGFRPNSSDDTCLSHLWYLMGANFILGRVKRRGSLDELMEVECHVRERVDFLMKDVLYFHNGRIDSWVRLGKTMKFLYHAATDAFAAVLGRHRRVEAYRWYTAEVLNAESGHELESPQKYCESRLASFEHVVLKWNLFQRIKEWKETNGTNEGHHDSKALSSKNESIGGTIDAQPVSRQIPVEEFATMYITQVIEFARRCFNMAAQLAKEASTTQKTEVQKYNEKDFTHELNYLESTIIECNEECGLLVFNVLQEMSLMKENKRVHISLDVYSRLVSMALKYFQKGLAICELSEHANEHHFRLLYMIGKTLKKRRWCELRQPIFVDREALDTATEMAECFSKADAARREGDREHALVHAFYALQALRIDLIMKESSTAAALRLACRHYYEGIDEEDRVKIIGGDNRSSSHDEPIKTTNSEDVEFYIKKVGVATTANSRRKDEILKLLSDIEQDNSPCQESVMLARGWLALNTIEALESIPDEDRYFHPSRYVLAQIVYWLSHFYVDLEKLQIKSGKVCALLAALQYRRSRDKVMGPCDAAARALKEMAPIFDKRRPQVVAIWISEYIPMAKKFEELNQRQLKYDYYRLKYWRFYIALLVENSANGRLKEVESWVLACKEEHDVIAMMLGIVLKARGTMLRRRLQEFVNTDFENPDISNTVKDVERLLKLLAKTYTYFLEVLNAQQRLNHVVEHCELVMENAELFMVSVFVMGVVHYSNEVALLEEDSELLDQDFFGNVTVILNALRRNELPPRIYDAHNRCAWKAYLNAAHSFCEDKWPDRSGKSKPSKKQSRSKAAVSLGLLTEAQVA